MPYILNEPRNLFPIVYLGYVDPTDHYSYKGILQSDQSIRQYNSMEELIDHVTERRKSLSYPAINHLPFIIEHYLYMLGEAPRTYFHKVDQKDLPQVSPDHARTFFKDIETGAKLAYSLSREAITGIFRPGSGGWVTLKEAAERAQACSNCPKNLPTKKSKSTRFNNKIAALFTLDRVTPYDKDLHDCAVCGCPLQEKVHYSAEVIKKTTHKSIKPESFPENFVGLKDHLRHDCWVRKILQQGNN